MEKMIEVEGLVKEYKQIKQKKTGIKSNIFRREYEIKKAINDISFSIQEGEVVGYLGLNGAGKSTTVKILSGILAPTVGRVRVGGMDPLTDRKKCTKFTSTLFGQKSQLWWDLPVEDSIELAKYLYTMPTNEFLNNYEYIDQYLDVSEIKKIPVRQLSLGQRMRANLCFSLLHNPKVLFLDEPTIGLDLLTKQRVWDCIKKMNAEKEMTVILTTHDVTDIESLCKRVLLIDKGSIVFDNSLEHLKNDFLPNRGMVIVFCGDENNEKIEDYLKIKRLDFKKINQNEYIIDVEKNNFLRSELFAAINKRFSIGSITPVSDSLNIVLTKIYESFGR